MLVVDASAVVELVLGSRRGRAVMEAIDATETLHAPDILGVEVVSALRRLIRAGELSAEDAVRALDTLGALGVETYGAAPFLPRVLELRDSLSAYDAIYVALAEALRAPIVTCDEPLARSHGHGAVVRLVGEAG